MAGALTFYRVMSFIVGTALLVLCAAIVVRYGFGRPTAEEVVGPIHGGLYIVYLVSVANLAMKVRLGPGRIVAMVVAGFVPLLAFYVEHRVVVAIEAEQP